jgi:hypothetical protein
MKKRNTLTFSQMAKKIIRKYDKRLGDGKYDKLAADSMNRELEALAAQQEATKQLETQNQFQEMCHGGRLKRREYGGGLPQMDGFGTSWLPILNQNPVQPFVYDKQRASSFSGVDNPNQTPVKNSWLSGIPKEALYGMLAQGLGTGLEALLMKKPKDINARPTQMEDYVPVRDDEAQQAARLAFANQQANSRYLSPSQYMAQMQGLARGEAQTLAQVIQGTENDNARGLNQWNAQKAGFNNDYNRQQLMADEINNRNQMNYNAYQAGVPGELGNVFAGGMKDVLGYKNFNNSLRFAGTANRGTIKGSDGGYYPLFDAGKGVSYYKDDKGTHFLNEKGEKITRTQYLKLLEG